MGTEGDGIQDFINDLARPAGLEPATPGLEGEIHMPEIACVQQLTTGAVSRCHARKSSLLVSNLLVQSSARAGQHLESGLTKMPVRREGMCQASFPHNGKARAVREREVFVAILKKQLPCLLEAVAVDALPAKPGTSVDLLPPSFGSA